MNQFNNEHYRRGYADGHAGKRRYYSASIYNTDLQAYNDGWHDGRQEVRDDYREECKADWQRAGEDE